MGRRNARMLGSAAVLLTIVGIVVAARAAAAPAVPFSQPVAVSPAGGYFLGPDVAVDAAGNAVVVWFGGHGDAPNLEIYAQRFNAAGAPLGAPVTVNATTRGQQRRPAVAMAADGSFVVAWDSDARSVWARRFAADGTPLTDEVAVGGVAAVNLDPDVAMAADGSFVVAWQRGARVGSDAIAVAAFAADGAPGSPERALHAVDGDLLRLKPAVAALPDGSFAVVWEQIDLDSGASAVQLRTLDAAAAPVGEAVVVASSRAAELRDPALAATPAGGLLVAWSSHDGARGAGVMARGYGAAGDAGPSVAIAPVAAVAVTAPAVAVAADGSAVVSWGETGPRSGAPAAVAARLLDAAGAPVGEPIYPLPRTASAQPYLSVSAALGATSNSALWLVWAQSAPEAPAEQSAIYARRFVEQLFTLSLPQLRR